MTFFTIALFLFAPCLLLPGIVAAFVYGTQDSDSDETSMQIKIKERITDVRQLDVDAREQSWRRENWEGPERYVADRIAEASQEVAVPTRYAEASVSVHRKEGGTERRRCSLCLN